MEKGHGKGLYTILGEGTVVEGSISVPHNLRIEGAFKGRIETSEEIIIGGAGVVNADKYVTDIFPLDKTKEAFDRALNINETIEVMVEV